MTTALPLVLQIQSDAMDESIPVTSLLRKTKAAAIKLGLEDELNWITLELEGYNEVSYEDLPKYRQLMGVMKVRNPYHGLQPLHFGDSELARTVSEAPAKQSTAELESILQSGPGPLQVQMSSKKINALMRAMKFPLEPVLTVNRAAIVGILSAVRNLILNWSLEMEKAGVLGEGMTFGPTERANAQPVTQQFNIQNVGVLGNMHDHATAINNQNVTGSIDLDAVKQVIDQLSQQITSLPLEIRTQLDQVVKEANDHINSPAPDVGRIRSLLQSAKTICEGAAGNIIATGAIALLTPLINSA